jgi:hypothetical protein
MSNYVVGAVTPETPQTAGLEARINSDDVEETKETRNSSTGKLKYHKYRLE